VRPGRPGDPSRIGPSALVALAATSQPASRWPAGAAYSPPTCSSRCPHQTDAERDPEQQRPLLGPVPISECTIAHVPTPSRRISPPYLGSTSGQQSRRFGNPPPNTSPSVECLGHLTGASSRVRRRVEWTAAVHSGVGPRPERTGVALRPGRLSSRSTRSAFTRPDSLGSGRGRAMSEETPSATPASDTAASSTGNGRFSRHPASRRSHTRGSSGNPSRVLVHGSPGRDMACLTGHGAEGGEVSTRPPGGLVG